MGEVFNEDAYGMPYSPAAPASGGVEYTPLLMDYVGRDHRADYECLGLVVYKRGYSAGGLRNYGSLCFIYTSVICLISIRILTSFLLLHSTLRDRAI